MTSRRLAAALSLFVLLANAAATRADPTAGKPASSNPLPAIDAPGVSDPEATLRVWNRPIVTFRATVSGRTPERRVEGAAERIAGLDYSSLSDKVAALPVESGDVHGAMVHVGGIVVFGLVEADMEPESRESFDDFVGRAITNLRQVLRARAAQGEGAVLLRGVAVSIPATIAFLAVVWLLARARRWIASRMSAASEERISRLGLDVRRQAAVATRLLANGIAWTLSAGAAYVWLTAVLVQFPYTEPWGHELGVFLRDTLASLAQGLVASVPSLVVIVLIFLITRTVVGIVTAFFLNVERGRVSAGGFDAETARATRRLVVVLLWLFALTVAYPHIPGSNTEAFRGLSVLVGLVISLGSTGLVNQIMSGFVVIYSRALRQGDWVRVGEIEGLVKEVGLLTTKLTTMRREEIAIPNAVLVGTSTTNYTSLAGADGPVASTTLTIGYDAPWRQVHALLELAAARTDGVRKEPAPRVLQRGLSDFYVEYQLILNLTRAEERFRILSELHGHIQDVFNEQGVQIMSPHFEAQPQGPVVVPKSKWFAAPARPAAAPAAESEPRRAG